jgi:hypothetical protein
MRNIVSGNRSVHRVDHRPTQRDRIQRRDATGNGDPCSQSESDSDLHRSEGQDPYVLDPSAGR